MRILVVDDHELVRRGVRTVLSSEPTITVCGEAIDGRDAVEKAKALHPDVVVMDVSMPNMNGLEATREIKRVLPQTEIVIVSQHDSPEMVRQAFKAGARGYVVKTAISANLLAAIAKVSQQGSFFEAPETANSNQELDAQEILQRSATLEKALRESEERFRSAMDNVAEGLYTLDGEGLVTYINPSAEAMFGWKSAELLGKKIHDVMHYKYPDGRPFPAADCPGLQVLQKGTELREHKDVFIRKDGSFFPVVFSASPMKINGAIVGIVVGFRDDTKRRESEDMLRRVSAQFQLVTDAVAVAVMRCSRDLRFTWVNPHYAEWIDQPMGQIVGHSIAEVLGKSAFEELRPHFDQVLAGKEVRYEAEVNFRGIGPRWISAAYIPTFDSAGATDGWIGSMMDISERRRIEAGPMTAETESVIATRLPGSSDLLNLGSQAYLVELLPVAVYAVQAPDGIIAWFNSRAADIWGRTPVLGDVDERFCGAYKLYRADGTYMAHCDTPMALALKTGASAHKEEIVIERPDGSRVTVSVHIDPIRDMDGTIVGAVNFFHDITERKQTEQTLREGEERFRAIVETNPECVKLVTAEGILLHMNSSGLAMVGADSAEMVIGKNVYDLIAPKDREKFRAFNERICRGEKGSLEFDIVGLQGVVRHMDTHAAPFRTPDGTVVQLGVTRDITERTRAEGELRRSEERLRALADGLENQVRARTRELEQGNAHVLQQTEQLRELSNRLLQIQDNERRHIARELHDSAGQIVTALGMNLGNISQHVRQDPLLREAIEDSQDLVQQLSKEIRTMSYLLHPPLLDESGLSGAIHWYIQGLKERSGLNIEIELSENFGRLSGELELLMFRAVQECLTNIHRHSGSNRATIRIAREAEGVSLEVRDEGKGISPERLSEIQSQGGGVGIRGMRERVRQFDGRMNIDSNEDGTKISFWFPLRKAATSKQKSTIQEARAAG